MIKYKHLLSAGQKKQILDALQKGGQLVIRPARNQQGGALGTILTSVGIPLAIVLASKLFGKGLSVSPRASLSTGKRGGDRLAVSLKPNMLMPYQQTPFLGTWQNPVGMGVKKEREQQKGQRAASRKKKPIQKHSAFRNNPVKTSIQKYTTKPC